LHLCQYVIYLEGCRVAVIYQIIASLFLMRLSLHIFNLLSSTIRICNTWIPIPIDAWCRCSWLSVNRRRRFFLISYSLLSLRSMMIRLFFTSKNLILMMNCFWMLFLNGHMLSNWTSIIYFIIIAQRLNLFFFRSSIRSLLYCLIFLIHRRIYIISLILSRLLHCIIIFIWQIIIKKNNSWWF
jgi:hypothetical protein